MAQNDPPPGSVDAVLGPITDKRLLEINQKIWRAREAGWRVCAPEEIRSVPALYRVHLEVVWISTNPLDGEVYADKGKLNLARKGLMKLAAAFGVEIVSTRRTDPRTDPLVAEYTVTGRRIKFDGTIDTWDASYTFDVRARMDAFRQKTTGKDPKITPAVLEKKCAEEQAALQTFRAQRAETGAIERLVAALPDVQRSGFSAEALQRPWLVARLVVDPGDDEQAKRMILSAAFKVGAGMFPAEAPQPPPPPPPDQVEAALNATHAARPPAPPKPEAARGAPAPAPAPPRSAPAAPPPSAPRNEAMEMFEGLDPDAQLATLETLAERKGYNTLHLDRPLDDFNPRQRLRFFAHLSAMPDKAGAGEEPADDDDVRF